MQVVVALYCILIVEQAKIGRGCGRLTSPLFPATTVIAIGGGGDGGE